MSVKAPDKIDIHVGKRVRMRRLMVGMSQETLGSELGLTFQQVQKYEKGTNRISASRMQHIAQILKVPVSFLFDGQSGAGGGPLNDAAAANISDFLATKDGLALIGAFAQITDRKLRRAIVVLVEDIAAAHQ